MAFKCLTSMIEEWITDAYCIMSLLNHIVPNVWQVTARWSTGKSCQRVQFEELDHMIKRHFDMRLVFHRPNKCTESQYVFSSEVQPGPIIEGCLKLDEAQERAEEKELAMIWCAWWDGRSGVSWEETQHVFNAALILRRANQSFQPSTPFPAEPADLSEEKIDVHVPSELHSFLSWIMTGKVQDMAPCLNERVELDNCFLLMSFLDVLFNFLSFICVTEFSYHFHVVHIAVMCKTYSYQKWNMVFFFLFFSISKPKVYSPIPCFFRFMFYLTSFANPLCFLKWFLCFDGP